jgi:hypothetical protein
MIMTDEIKSQLSKAYDLITSAMDIPNEASHVSLHGIDIKDSEVKTVVLSSGKFKDIYALIDDSATSVYLALYDVLAFITFGWASPTSEPNMSPSEHPERRRVRLINYMFSSNSYIVSSLDLDYKQDTQETLWEYDSATSGSLKDELLSMAAKAPLL